jgi:AhpD family alkylhydroperoxidase
VLHLAGQAAVAEPWGPPGFARANPEGWSEWRAALAEADLPAALRLEITAARSLLARDPGLYSRALRRGEALSVGLDARLEPVDVLALPTVAIAPPLRPAGEPDQDLLYGDTRLTAPFNVTGHPRSACRPPPPTACPSGCSSWPGEARTPVSWPPPPRSSGCSAQHRRRPASPEFFHDRPHRTLAARSGRSRGRRDPGRRAQEDGHDAQRVPCDGSRAGAAEGYAGLAGALDSGLLPKRVREQVALAVAARNGCDYCLAAHRTGGRFARLSAQEIAAAERGEADDPKEAAGLALALELLERVGDADDATLARARAAGFSDAEVVELAGHVALNVLTNTVNRLARNPERLRDHAREDRDRGARPAWRPGLIDNKHRKGRHAGGGF